MSAPIQNPDPGAASTASRTPLTRTLTFQVIFITAVVLAVGLSLHGVRVVRDQIAAAETSARDHAYTLARTLASVGAVHLLVGDYAALESALMNAGKYPHVRGVLVLDSEKRIVSEVVNDSGEPRALYRNIQITVPADLAEPKIINDGSLLEAWEAVWNGTSLGWVRVRYELDELAQVRQRVIAGTTAIVVVAILFSVVVVWIYLRRPLRAIHDATRYAAKLDSPSGAKLHADSGVAELDVLQRSLNAAAQELRARHEALNDSREMLQLILNYAADSIISIGPDGHIRSFNGAAEHMFGYTADEVIGKNINVLMPDPYRSAHDGYLRRYLQSGQTHILGRLREVSGQRKDGSVFPMELAVSEIRTRDRHLFVGVVRDVSDRKRAEEMSSRLGRILEHSSSEIYIFEAITLKLSQFSRGALTNLGYTPEELAGLTLADVQPELPRAEFDRLVEPLHTGAAEAIRYETTFRRGSGEPYSVEVSLQLSQAEGRAVYVAIVQDITERKKSEQQLHFLANYDTLTGLPNRAQLQKRMEQSMVDAQRANRLLAALFVDLDRFKLVNDTMGHEAGDELLRIIARRIVETLRPGDTVARLGGDEFIVLLANVADVSDIDKMAERILQRLGAPVRIGGRDLYVTPSLGISVYPTDAKNSESLLKNADAAMYLAKEQGRNCARYFTADLNARAARRLALETSLRRALEQEQFVVHYQPQVNASTGEITGAEALVRWRHPELGLIPPNEFIPLAEDTGLIVPLGRWVLETAARHAQHWRSNGFPQVRVGVNISGRQLARDTLVRTVQDTIQVTGLDPRALDLELTETLLMQNLDETALLLGELANLGVTVSMDDFGTGYSSLSYLKRLPIHTIKIDRSFVRDIVNDTDTGAIVSAIIVMARGLRIGVVAEGVESHDQFEYLRLGLCSGMQGFYFSRPVPFEGFAELLRSTNGRFSVPDYGTFRIGGQRSP